MKICVAQTKPVKGDIQKNIEQHRRFIDLAVAQGTSVIIFPELSLTGYEPTLAETLATQIDDARFDDFQKVSDEKNITIGVGVPTRNDKGICISMVIFQPNLKRKIYSKRYLHPDEEEFFVRGENFGSLKVDNTRIALAICYEISVAEHIDNAYKTGSRIYIASVAKFVHGIDKALKTLADTANKNSMTVLMSNFVGESDGYECAGKSSIWNNRGVLIGELDDKREGILIFDDENLDVIEEVLIE